MKAFAKKFSGGALGAVLLIGIGIFAWLLSPAPLLPEATAATHSTPQVNVTHENGNYVFLPSGPAPNTALIFYPGARVPPEAYAPAALTIAEAGYGVFIIAMPFNLAVFNTEAAQTVQAAHPNILHWAIGGHSLGGAMAAEYVARHPDTIQGVVFWASYASSDISTQAVKVVSIYGALDTGRADYISDTARQNVPLTTQYVEIAGGNHEQCGYYTGQPNDPTATTSRTDQQAQLVAATMQLLSSLSTP